MVIPAAWQAARAAGIIGHWRTKVVRRSTTDKLSTPLAWAIPANIHWGTLGANRRHPWCRVGIGDRTTITAAVAAGAGWRTGSATVVLTPLDQTLRDDSRH